MSVQAGVWNFEGVPIERELLTRISSRTSQFGPDGNETFIYQDIGMLYRPFHTTMESRREHQPHRFGNGKVITWDGRLDNRDELISALGWPYAHDSSDVAIVGGCFERSSTACFRELLGDWACAVWDPEKQELILARDYIGVRHLFYYADDKRFAWCNHLEPLVLCATRLRISEKYIAGYLAFYPDADLTPYEEIRSVRPAHFLRIQARRVSTHCYWSFNPKLKVRYRANSGYEEEFRRLFRQAVRRRLRAETPILAGLSGGLDSSSIVCMADEIATVERVAVPRLDTFSFCDRDEPDEEDFLYFNAVEQRRGRIGHRADLKTTGDTLSFDHGRFTAVPGFGERQELKIAREQLVRKEGYKVFLSGVGGDEFTGQALDFRVQMADLFLQLRWIPLTRQLIAWSLITRHPWLRLFSKTALMVGPTWLRTRLTRSAAIDVWIRKDFAQRHSFSCRLLTAAEGRFFWRPSVKDAYQTYTNLARQMTFNSPGLIETRYPFLDRDLVEFLMAIPTEQLVQPGNRRSLMRRAIGHMLPPEILSRQTKSSTGRCVSLSLRKHWGAIRHLLASPISAELGFIESSRLLQSLAEAREGKLPMRLLPLLKALSLEIWLRGLIATREISGINRVEKAIISDPVSSQATLLEESVKF